MSLVTGVRLVRSRWTPLPLPRDSQSRVESFGSKQNMPKTLTFGDCHGHEIPDSLEDIEEWSDDDDDTYEFQEDPDMDDFSYDDDDDEEVNDINNNNICTQPSTSDDTDNHENTGVNGTLAGDDTVTSTGLEAPGNNILGEIAGVVGDLEASNETSEITGVEQDVAVDEAIEMDDDEEIDDSDPDDTEEAEYKKAEQMGLEAAHDDDGTLPKRVHKKKADEIYEYYNAMFTRIDVDRVFSPHDDEHSNQVLNFLTDQMSAKAGPKEFGDKGAASIMQELEQLLYRKVIVGRKASSLTPSQRKAALQYLMFLKEK